jgi:hypothetical protein
MTEADRTVVISDARYHNPSTGETSSPNKYHLLGFECIRNTSPHRLEVPESVALAFGRTLCGTCANNLKRQEAIALIEDKLKGVFEGSPWDAIIKLLPPEIEVRFFWHEPGKTTPRTIWTSKPKEG